MNEAGEMRGKEATEAEEEAEEAEEGAKSAAVRMTQDGLFCTCHGFISLFDVLLVPASIKMIKI